ncbi:hypothetical protein BP5796_02456 [Coleophoma crateriformis]|uniref:DUF218 domain-containing protein n=1 Tax=Coleophoma crateriformis TaxID=565419 RepID=A0A3D8SYP7_9HELO|nr:hypothetical protein BP5796_02456 [Coleophoma crateriformis]
MDIANLKHLVLVCCHAIYLGGYTRGECEKEWLLASFQKGETKTFRTHLQAGLSVLHQDPSALLVLSGSKTRREVDISEARSYLDLAIDNDFWSIVHPQSATGARILLEEQAMDSMANLTFSLLMFWKTTKRWPEKITIISHEFKKERFLDYHVKALGLDPERVVFLGLNPPYMNKESSKWDAARTEDVLRGETERGLSPWKADMLGKREVLSGKRRSRNCWGVSQMWFLIQEERIAR